jgi:hypothetical protein
MRPIQLILALAAIGIAVPAAARTSMGNTQAAQPMNHATMQKTTMTRHTSMTTHRSGMKHKKPMMSCRRMSHEMMRRTARCRSMMHNKSMKMHHVTMKTPHHSMKATVKTETKTETKTN